MTFTHVAMGRDAASGAQGCAFAKFLANFGDRARSLERATERIRSAFLERLHFFARQRLSSQYSFAKKTESMPYSRASQPGGSGPAPLSTWMSPCRRLLRKLTAL